MRPARPPSYADFQLPTLLVIVVISVLGCAARSSPRRWLLYIPLLSLSVFFIFYIKTGNLVSDYSQSMWIATNLFVMSDFLLLTDVQIELRKKGPQGSILPGSQSFFERLKWGFDLYTSSRGVGWEHEPTAYLPPRLPSQPATTSQSAVPLGSPRLRFLSRQVLVLVQCLLLYVVGDVAMQMNSSFETAGPPFDAQVGWMRLTVLGHALATRAIIESGYTVASIVTVSLGIFDVDAWPPLFGSLLDAYSVHNLWRRVWHQMMRRFLTVHIGFLSNIRNKDLRRSTKLYAAFFISGFIHYMGDVAVLGDWSGASLKFFMLQPIAITFEHTLSYLVRRSGFWVPRWFARMAGYTWVVVWFTMTIPIWLQPLVRVGLIEDGWHSPVVVALAGRLKADLGVEV